AIIAILAAILFPVFAQAREKARQASCVSNLKQVGTGVTLYVQDYDERLPYNYNYSFDGQYLWWWQDSIRPYVKNEPVYQCPSAPPPSQWTSLRPPGTPSPLIRDYIANAAATAVDRGYWPLNNQTSGRVGPFTNSGSGTPSAPRSLADIDDSAGTIGIF